MLDRKPSRTHHHRLLDEMTGNMCDATPTAPASGKGANQIFNASAKPRLPMREIESVLEDLAAAGDIEVIVLPGAGRFRTYRWRE